MKKLILIVISAMIFTSCSNQPKTNVSTIDSTIVDSIDIFIDSLEMDTNETFYNDSLNKVI